MFEYAANQKSPRIGKPNRAILDLCLEYFGLKEDGIVLIGDNLETDIKLGYEQNIETVLVQTGVHNKEDIERLKIYPTHVVNTLMDLVDYNFSSSNSFKDFTISVNSLLDLGRTTFSKSRILHSFFSSKY